MKLLFRQRVFSWFDSYDVFDEEQAVLYTVKGRLAWGHCLEIYDREGRHEGTVKEEVFSLMPRFALYAGGDYLGEIQKKFTLFHPVFTLNYGDWQVTGDILAWNYQVVNSRGETVMNAYKEVLSWSDTYTLEIVREEDALLSLMIVLAIDAAKCSN